METKADMIRAVVVARVLERGVEVGKASFSIGEALEWLHGLRQVFQQQAVGDALTAKEPLLRFGITSTEQSGHNGNQAQVIHWAWDPASVRRRAPWLLSELKAIKALAAAPATRPGGSDRGSTGGGIPSARE